MGRFGFIHEKLDIKILILFILRRLPGEVDPNTLVELCQCDEGIDYFDYSECVAELVETGHIKETETGYTITEKGIKNAELVETSIPYCVRAKAKKLLAPEAARLARLAMITAEHSFENGGCFVHLAMNDGTGEIIDLKLLCSGEEQAETIEKNFRRGAENMYLSISELLSKTDN